MVKRDVALVYLRKSVLVRGAEDKLSEERQQSACLALCEQRGWRPEIYTDFTKKGHHSGRSDLNRPAWLKLKSQLARPEIAAIVVESLSRSYRNTRLLLELLDNELAPRGISLICTTMPDLDFTSASGRNFLISLANSDEYFSRITGETMKSAIANFRRGGRHWGRVPFGLQALGKGREYHLERAEDGSFEVVMAAWQKYTSSDIGASGLCDFLNEAGYRAHGRPLTANLVRQIISSWEAFAGYISVGGTRHSGPRLKANFEPLADPALIAQVAARQRERMGSKRNHRPQTHPPMLLQGLLKCASCGIKLYSEPAREASPGKRGRAQTYYYHRERWCRDGKPNPRYVDASELDDEALDFIDDRLDLEDAQLLGIAQRKERQAARKPDPARRIRAQVEKQEREWRGLGLSDETIAELRATLEHALLPPPSGHEPEAALIPERPVSVEDRIRRLRLLGSLIWRTREREPVAANEAMRTLFKCIRVQDGKISSFEPQAWAAPFFKPE